MATELNTFINNGGTMLGEIKYFSSTMALNASGKYVPCDGQSHKWSDYPDYQALMGGIPSAVNYYGVSKSLSEGRHSAAGSMGGFKKFGNPVWLVPSDTSQICVRMGGNVWGDSNFYDQTVGASGGIPNHCVPRSDHGGEGMLVTYLSSTSTICYSTNTNLNAGWVNIDLNATIGIAANSPCRDACNSGASGRWYALFTSGLNAQIAYSGVDDVSSGWTLWTGTVTTPGGSNPTHGSIAVKEGVRWMWSLNGDAAPGRIYGTASLNGTGSLMLDISASDNMGFYLTYDAADDVFIALPGVAGYPIYTSIDDGATWLKGDVVHSTPYHKAVKYDTANKIYLFGIQDDKYPFAGIKLDANNKARVINFFEDGAKNKYTALTSSNCFINVNPDTSISLQQSGSVTSYQINLLTDLSNEFGTPWQFNTEADVTNQNTPSILPGTYPAIKVKN